MKAPGRGGGFPPPPRLSYPRTALAVGNAFARPAGHGVAV